MKLEASLDRLRDIVGALDSAEPREGVELIREANGIVAKDLVTHERADETKVYPRLRRSLASGYGLAAMSRVHRELLHLAHLLSRMTEGLSEGDIDAIAIRDGPAGARCGQHPRPGFFALQAMIVHAGGSA
jgi:Hemerythrin HHE cation binding domain